MPPVGLPDRIAFVGLGLIGGSVALALRAAGYRGSIAAWSPDGRGPASAGAAGVLKPEPSAESALHGAGLVVLAGPPLAILDALAALGGPWRAALGREATVTDVGSTKAVVVAAAETAALPFVGGHPMAGRDASGFEAASADLFVDRPWVIVPSASARPVDVATTEALAAATGARPMRMSAAAHDTATAAISHVPLVLAAALVEAVAEPADGADASWSAARGLAATGWRDMTRLARGDPAMGAGILATNGPAVASRLREVRAAVDAWIAELDVANPDSARIRARLERARAAITEEP